MAKGKGRKERENAGSNLKLYGHVGAEGNDPPQSSSKATALDLHR